SKPFFLMLHQKAPHGKWEYAKRHKDYLAHKDIPEPMSLYKDKNHGPLHHVKYGTSISLRNPRRNMVDQTASPKWATGQLDTIGLSNSEKTSRAYQKYLKDYLRCIKAIDENVGRILNYLDETGLSKNTIVIYTSDQGQFIGGHDYFDKRWMYEESLHMPFLIRYPQKIKARTTNDKICINADFAPTFLDYTGISTPAWMQGKSFKPLLEGKKVDSWRKSMYYRYWMHMSAHDNPAHYGVRSDRYKLIFFYGLPLGKKGAKKQATIPHWEFYDLKKDPHELNNQYENSKYNIQITQMKEELIRLKEKYKDTDDVYPELMKIKAKYWVH
ncbi:sulfatase-like hydrolase/transferase, partial [Prolixibacteraceae bacterium]|nr:sulfatase-like hydrolase/transferase [Prolixibacteraceae bacterium]